MRRSSFGDLRLYIANRAWLQANKLKSRRFFNALKSPGESQRALLRDIVERNRHTEFGRKFRFRSVRTYKDYVSAVPIQTYDEMAPWIEQIKRGRRNVLTAEAVTGFVKSSGTTASSKYIPYTATLGRQFQAAVYPWLADTYSNRPGLLRSSAYWSFSGPPGRETTASGLEVGMSSDADYLGIFDRLALSQILAVLPDVTRHHGMENVLYATALRLVKSPSLGLISVWSPSFAIVLLSTIAENRSRLIEDVMAGRLTLIEDEDGVLSSHSVPQGKPDRQRAEILRRAVSDSGAMDTRALWPGLSLISCWASGPSARLIPTLRKSFPGVEIQPKGLLATEGVVTIPIDGRLGGTPCLVSHFLEFVPLGSADESALSVTELSRGSIYKVILTTGGGLYRYDMQDAVRVEETRDGIPQLEFVGKTGNVSDMVGEKLNDVFVQQAVNKAEKSSGLHFPFILVSPDRHAAAGYAVTIGSHSHTDSELLKFSEKLEVELQRNHHYAHARSIGQLARLKTYRIGADAATRFNLFAAQKSQEPGNVKLTALRKERGWPEALVGVLVVTEEHREQTENVARN